MKIIDITPEISNQISVWPGDVPYSRSVSMDTDNGDHMGLSSITTTVHLGAHVDAPNHYVPGAKGISERSLHYYMGPCQVISCSVERGERLKISDLNTQEIMAPRVLFNTGSFPDPNQWNDDFSALSEELVVWLAKKHVLLVGIDTPSVDLINDKNLMAHHRVAENNMAILEGIVLKHVDDGLYDLHALPLKLMGADASPVRAVLVSQ